MKKQFRFKVALVGDFGSGKTSLYKRMSTGCFSEEEDLEEEIDFCELSISLAAENASCRVSLFDTAGMEQHNGAMEGSYFRGLKGAFLVYGVDNWKSFQRIEYWKKQVENYAAEDIKIMLLGNKCDCGSKERVVEEFEGKTLGSKLDFPFMECSAKSGLGCKAALEVLCRNMVRGQMSDDNPTYAPAEPKLVTLDKGSLDPNGGKNNKKCCK